MAKSYATPKLAPPTRPDPSGDRPAPEDLPQVIILGRTNVGKSTLFNRVIGGREAIVHEARGVTRDRLKRTAEWEGTYFAITDQAGWEATNENPFHEEIGRQIDLALREADVIWFVIDRQAGVTSEDRQLAEKLRILRDKTPILLVVNKADDPMHDSMLYDSYELGFGDPWPVSAIHGRGIAELLEATHPFLLKMLEEPKDGMPDEDAEKTGPLTFAILGRQNAGKSSLFNHLVGSERSIVSTLAGTTRDAIDARFTYREREFCSIDTAGLKRKNKIDTDVDYYSMRRAEQALTRAEVAVLVLDVSLGITDLDQKIAELIRDSHRSCVLVANKWDLSAGLTKHQQGFIDHIHDKLHYLFWAPVVFTSALEGTGLPELLHAIQMAHNSFHQRMATSEMNGIIAAIWEANPPSVWRNRRGKIYYATQVGVAPPHVVLSVNTPTLFVDGWRRYLYKALHQTLKLPGSPIRISYRARKRKAQE